VVIFSDTFHFIPSCKAGLSQQDIGKNYLQFFIYWLACAIGIGRSVILWLIQTILHALNAVPGVSQLSRYPFNQLK